jgi:hypothetical protein
VVRPDGTLLILINAPPLAPEDTEQSADIIL